MAETSFLSLSEARPRGEVCGRGGFLLLVFRVILPCSQKGLHLLVVHETRTAESVCVLSHLAAKRVLSPTVHLCCRGLHKFLSHMHTSMIGVLALRRPMFYPSLLCAFLIAPVANGALTTCSSCGDCRVDYLTMTTSIIIRQMCTILAVPVRGLSLTGRCMSTKPTMVPAWVPVH